MDQSGLYAMEDVLQDLKRNGIVVLFVDILEQPKYMMERIDIIPDLIPEKHLFEDFQSCINWVVANVEDKY
jgi:SulP family sulfate permease